jgi:hypothetical protein
MDKLKLGVLLLAFLLDNQGKLDAQSQADIQNPGKVVTVEQSFYFRKNVTAFGTFEFKTGTQTAVDGITNLDKGLIGSRNMALGVVTVTYANAASGTTVANQDYRSNIFATDNTTTTGALLYTRTIPKEFVNAWLEIYVGQDMILTFPLRKVFTEGYTKGNNEQTSGSFSLTVPKLLPAGKIIEFKLRTGEGVAIPSSSHFLEIGLEGVCIASR